MVCSEREEAGLRQFERATSPQTSSPRQRSPTAKPLALQIGSNRFAGGQSAASTGSTRAQDGSVGRGVARGDGDGSAVRGAAVGSCTGLAVGGRVGSRDGLSVGFLEGSRVGIRDGRLVGRGDGGKSARSTLSETSLLPFCDVCTPSLS